MNKKAFTLVEIMIVVLVVGILAVIAIPNFLRAAEISRTNTCVANLRLIQSAKSQWQANFLEGKSRTWEPIAKAADIKEDMLVPAYMPQMPKCPDGGTYTIGDVSHYPTCSVGGEHSLTVSKP